MQARHSLCSTEASNSSVAKTRMRRIGKEIKDIMAYLRLIYQPEDRVSFERIVNVPTRGIGTKSVENFYGWMQANNLGLQQALESVSIHPNLTAKAKSGLLELGDILARTRELMDEVALPGLDTFVPVICGVGYAETIHKFVASYLVQPKVFCDCTQDGRPIVTIALP